MNAERHDGVVEHRYGDGALMLIAKVVERIDAIAAVSG
jgi:hypothetical protein